MVDFGARIKAEREAERQRQEVDDFLRLELDRQLQELGRSLIEFRTQHRLQRWTEAHVGTPQVSWSARRSSLFGAKVQVATVSGPTVRVMPVKCPYGAYVMEDGRWILALTEHSSPSGVPAGNRAPRRSFLVSRGSVTQCFSAGPSKVLSGSIPEDSQYGDKNYWHLDMTPTGTVGKSVGTRRFSLEDELAEMLRNELEGRR